MNPSEEKSSFLNFLSEKHLMMNKMKIHPRSIIKEKMNIEPDKTGYVIGRRFSNLKRIEEIYGVDITLPEIGRGSRIILEESVKTVYIEGLADMVFAAKKDIEDCIKHTTRFIIEQEYVFAIIGRGGKKIESLRKANKVSYIDIKEDGQVTIVGSQKRCESAKEAIESRIQRYKTAKTYVYEEKFSVPSNLLGHVIGRKFSNLIRLDPLTENSQLISADPHLISTDSHLTSADSHLQQVRKNFLS